MLGWQSDRWHWLTDHRQQLIGGVGNEVLFVTCATVAIVSIITITCVWRWRAIRINQIHPSNESVVRIARRVLLSNRFLNQQPNGDGTAVTDEGQGQDQDRPDDNHDVVNSVPHYGMDNQCPVCLNEPRFPIETNCGHLFCAQCLIVYWRHGNWLGPVRCPVCRQQVSVLLQCFSPNQRLSADDQAERTRLMHEINDYNRRYSGEPRPWLDYIWDLPTLLRHLTSEFFTVGGLMYMFRIRIVLCFVAAIMYLISPLDMIPEAIFGLLGLLDDIFVVVLLAIYVTIIYRRFLSTRWEDE